MIKSRFHIAAITLCIACLTIVGSSWVRAGDEKKADKSDKSDKAVMAHDAFDAIKTLEGTWTKPGPDGKPADVVFKTTANGSVVIETMFPGSQHEMVNTYHMDNDRLLVTHYCAQGVQPRMQLVSSNNGVLKFDYFDCTNLKEGEAHMGGLEISINGDQMTEKWGYMKDGKVVSETPFEFTKKQ
jgi:hypothetical protein